jgi:2TM domain
MTDVLTPTRNGTAAVLADELFRREALRQLKKKQGFRTHLIAYVLVNGFLWVVWGVIYAAASGPWFPWPVFPLFGWGIGLALHAWDVYGRKPFTEEAIDREVARLRADRRTRGSEI